MPSKRYALDWQIPASIIRQVPMEKSCHSQTSCQGRGSRSPGMASISSAVLNCRDRGSLSYEVSNLLSYFADKWHCFSGHFLAVPVRLPHPPVPQAFLTVRWVKKCSNLEAPRDRLTLMLLVANLADTKWCKFLKNDRNPGKWVLIWEFSARAFQWIPAWYGFDGFYTSLCPCDL